MDLTVLVIKLICGAPTTARRQTKRFLMGATRRVVTGSNLKSSALKKKCAIKEP
jgi:hypothetical protein